ncbi:DNA recombination protein RmuC [Marinobacter salarius]|jgi:DNA recombination protein RmuC|uniref:DNA recombination protein RmuC n=1 Tax=Marinobacter salarius TaxID=1420917 RepID=UPI001BCAAEE6|nr:DNA recombination protein RmuC [Marinobacter salarius]MBS8231289.1 DNA recombination protein RmuC [Marinobacter salarius]|tara:strand:- start:7497 stop:9350 length:1854 start_codon:yes stop_codon:yes gene_type:complete
MQTIQWTNELIVIASLIGIALAGLGFLMATVVQSRKVARLTAQLEQLQGNLEQADALNQSLQDSMKDLESSLHEKDLAESRLQAQLTGAQSNEQRLTDELRSQKEEFTSVNAKLEESRQRHHATERQLETFQADNRALQERVDDLRERLGRAELDLQEEREQMSQLKERLAEEGKKAKALESSDTDAREQLKETKVNLSAQQERYSELQERYQSLSSEHTELKTTLERKEEHFQEQMQQLGETKQALTKEFENIANKIFEEKGKTFTQTSQSSIDSMLKPFREQIEGFQKRINEVHDASLQGNSNLNAEIRKVLDIGLQMSKEATSLTSALKGDSQQRGAWGEAQLRRTLEMSGLIEDAHFAVQSSFKDDEGKQKQTDYLIKLPDDKHIIIDSKVSLVAYDRAVSADTEEEYNLAMAEHVKAVRRHIDDLAGKDYTNLVGMRSPSFVLMFMPIEPAYIEALKSNKDLFEYGYKKNIVLVSHTTLIPILRTVSNLWMIERSNAEAREISEKAGDIYNQVCTVAERLNKLGGTLNTVSNHYNDTVTALAGKQGLYGKVERFTKLSAKVTKSMPAIEPAHRDFETERLSMIVEAIEEPDEEDSRTLDNPEEATDDVATNQ